MASIRDSLLASRSSREVARSGLLQRLQGARGLSNPAYLAASSGTSNLRLVLQSARVKFTLSDPIADALAPAPGGGAVRGSITELSVGARDRLADRAWSLSAEGQKPSVMVTLTSPGNWEQVYGYDPETGEVLEGGRILKNHMAAFRKRLHRFFERHQIFSWSALWFLEFQKRGAPHIHLMLFGCEVPESVRRQMRSWAGRAWSSIVGNPVKAEQAKHCRAGTQVARVRVPHFGYAVKYATKTEQKEVPSNFASVGRFWGVWNYKGEPPIEINLDVNLCNSDEFAFLLEMVNTALTTIYEHAPKFYWAKLNKILEINKSKKIPYKFGFSVYGQEASQKVKGVF